MAIQKRVNWSVQPEFEQTRAPVKAARSSQAKRIAIFWVIGMLVLLPMNIVNLPLNMALVDYWIVMGLPFLWLFVIRDRQPVSTSYILAMWIILVASFLSTFNAAAPSKSFVVILKEVYVFVWFVTLAILFSNLNDREMRRLMTVWSGMVVLHGLLIIAQFLSPELWQSITRAAGRSYSFEFYRPSGLFLCDTAGCANRAAYFQLLGFVPLMLAGFRKRQVSILGTLLFLSILATGSMGATLGFLAGLFSAIVVIAIMKKRLSLMVVIGMRLLVVVALLGGLFYALLSRSERYQDHFQRIIVGRADRSAGGRFNLWGRGLDVAIDRQIGLWGIGPENFRVVDWQGKQLHNDLLAFLVERGILGVIGLVAFALIAGTRAMNLVLFDIKFPQRASLVGVIFLAAAVATLVESLTHQIFHDRQLWLVLALQEAMVFKAWERQSYAEQAESADYSTR